MPNVLRRGTAAMLLTLAPLAGLAQTSPYYIGASQSFGFDNNIFRVPDRQEIALPGGGVQVVEPQSAGLISTTLLLAGLNQTIGRQRVYGTLSAGYSSYASQSQLDSPRYALTAGVDWDTAEKVSGNVDFTSGRRLGAFGNRDLPTGRGNNDERYNRFTFLARLGDWQRSRTWVETSLVADELTNEIQFLEPVPYDIVLDPVTGLPVVRFSTGYRRHTPYTAFTLGLRYRQSGALVLGAGVRTESRREDFERNVTAPVESIQTSSLKSRRNDFDLFATFNPSSAHDLTARLSYGKRDYENPDVPDDAGWSSNLNWAWKPTGKLDNNVRLLYDTEDRDQGGASAADSSGNRKTLALEWRLRYAMTGKISTDLSGNFYRRTYGDVGGFTDHDSVLSFTVNWAVLRNAALGCTLSLDRRSSSYQGPESGRSSYNAQLGSCFGQITLQ
jgi:hypothetical protein